MKKSKTGYLVFLKRLTDTHFFKVMRVTVFLILIGISSVFASSTYSQATKFTLNLRNVSLEQLFEEIQSQSEFNIFYKNSQVDKSRIVDITVSNASVEDILIQALEGMRLDFKVVDRQIVIFPEKSLNNEIKTKEQVKEQPQKKKISGKITDSSGQSLPGVTVIVKGTTIGTVTDNNGQFTLKIPIDAKLLQISFVGMETQEILIGNNTVFDIGMEKETVGLEEVVAVGYGTQKKGMLTGSISNVNSEKLTVAPIGNTTNLLAGQLTGVISKQRSGVPGDDAATLNIRGFGSPLIIVDGVESSMSNIDSWQIESISILKDGAASIYGSRAGNGVILITTKRGKIQKPTISLNSSFTMQGSTKIHKPQNSGQRAHIKREIHINKELPMEQVPYTEEQVEKFFRGDDPHYLNTDWFDATLRNYAPQQNHNISISGGTENLKFYGFLGYNNQETIIKNDGGSYDRYNFQATVDADITKNLTMSVNVNSIFEDRIFSYLGLYGGSNFWMDLYGADPKLPVSLPDETKLSYGGLGYGNLIAAASTKINGYSKTRGRNNRTSGALKYDVKQLAGLSLKAFISMNESSSKLKEFRKQHNFYRYNIDTEEYTFERAGIDPTGLMESYSFNRIFTQQYSVNYENLFKEKHRVSFLGLYENIAYNSDNFSGSRSDFMSTSIEQLSAGNASTSYANGGASEMGRVSWVGRLNYAFKDKYLIETIIRADASAKFPASKRWGYFPSISLGWVVSEENFLNNKEFIDNLKIRVSYGESGNDGVGNFQYLSGYGFDGQYILGNATYSGLYVTGLANPALTWEKMKIYNGAIDFSLAQRKLYGTVEGFYRLREGIPGRRHISLPSTFGAELPLENLNDINTPGIELSVGTYQKYGNFSMDVGVNFTLARSKWAKYDEPEYTDPDQNRLYKKTGQWTDRRFGYVFDGLFESQEQIDALPYIYSDLGDNSSLRPGDVIFKDINNDKVLDWRDQVELGSGTMPHSIYGIVGLFKYKNFDLNCLFQGALGYYSDVDLLSVPTDFAYKHRWTQENPDPNALIPRIGGSSTNGYLSSYRLHKTSYIRLKNASIGYDVSKKLINKLNIQRLRVYVAGTNLFTASTLGKYGVDPEVADGNGPSGMPIATVYYYPQQRTFSVGVNLSF